MCGGCARSGTRTLNGYKNTQSLLRYSPPFLFWDGVRRLRNGTADTTSALYHIMTLSRVFLKQQVSGSFCAGCGGDMEPLISRFQGSANRLGAGVPLLSADHSRRGINSPKVVSYQWSRWTGALYVVVMTATADWGQLVGYQPPAWKNTAFTFVPKCQLAHHSRLSACAQFIARQLRVSACVYTSVLYSLQRSNLSAIILSLPRQARQ